jgi:TPR repeat protein
MQFDRISNSNTSKDTAKMRAAFFIPFVAVIYLTPNTLLAAEVRGKVVHVSGKEATIEVSPRAAVNVGNRVELFVILPDIGEEAHVAAGRVTKSGTGQVVATLDEATSQLAVGHEARILSGVLPLGSNDASAGVTDDAPQPVAVPPPASSPTHGTGNVWFGVTAGRVNPTMAQQAGLPRPLGAYVSGVYPNSPAATAGLIGGDIVVKVGDTWIMNNKDLAPAVVKHSASEQTIVTFARNGERKEATVTLLSAPSAERILASVTPLAEQGQVWAQYQMGIHYRSVNDMAQAASWFRKAAEQGDSQAQAMLAGMLLAGEGIPKDVVQALDLAQKSAAQDDASGQAVLGKIYVDGLGTSQDYTQARTVLAKSAAQDHPVGQVMLGHLYEYGHGVEKNERTAAEWYLRAAMQGDPEGQTNLGRMFFEGKGVRKDHAKALHYFRQAADQGYAAAMGKVGWVYFKRDTTPDGDGVPEDLAESRKWFLAAAEHGDIDSCFQLGVTYAYGEGVPQDYKEAMKWFHKAALKGMAGGQHAVGTMTSQGLGFTRDPAKASKWFELAAKQGHSESMNSLAVLYEHGQGVTQDFRRAFDLYQQAANLGNPYAQHNVGVLYLLGKGVAQDNEAALGWFRAAADQNFANSQHALGRMYQNGQGVPQNRVEAIAWYLKASDQGFELAKQDLRLLGVEP